MKVIKPAWVTHKDEKDKTLSIFCLHIHPDCTRLATGGLDAKVKIWSTLPILSEEADANEANPKLLSTLTLHNGPVLSVRWAHHGRYLASGSDDGVVMIWDIDPHGGGKVWGSDDVNVESWKPVKRLVGHESDVADVAWSQDDSMIASVGLDSTIYIWDGHNFERIRKIDSHQGFVKGVTWDPVGQYLATQSDDRTVKIWNTEDWSLVQEIKKPFERSPANTFFRRLSWSPDGSFIAASNAMNGPVFVAAIIDRHDWSSDISFVGHENTIQVAAFNPRIFFPPGAKKVRGKASCMLALGADDSSISIWRNTRNKPLLVVKDIFDRQILDLCWSNDGHTIYGCSSDGSICAIHFEDEEIPNLSPMEDTDMILKSFEYDKKRTTSRPSEASRSLAPLPFAGPTPFRANAFASDAPINELTAKPRKQKITMLPSGKRRIQPSLIQSLGTTGMISSLGSVQHSESQTDRVARLDETARAFADAAEQPLESQSRIADTRDAIIQGVDDAFEDLPVVNGKRRASEDISPDKRITKARTLGGDRPRETGPIKEIRPAMMQVFGNGSSSHNAGPILSVPAVQNELRSLSEEDNKLCLEAANNTSAKIFEISMRKDGAVQWLDYSRSPIVGLAVTPFIACATDETGNLTIYSKNGVKLLAPIRLDSPVSFLHACKHYVAVLTCNGTLNAWNVNTRKALFPAVSIQTIIATSANDQPISIKQAQIRPNGTVWVQLSSGTCYAYNADFQAWEELCSTWLAENSTLWTRTRGNGNKNVVSGMEADLNGLQPALVQNLANDKPRWWEDALTLGHFETRMRAAILLDSAVEYKSFLLMYAKKIAEEGYKGKGEELVRDLHGPIYYNAPNDKDWSPIVCGLSKRDLVREILGIFGKTRSLGEIAQVWQERLKAASQEAST